MDHFVGFAEISSEPDSFFHPTLDRVEVVLSVAGKIYRCCTFKDAVYR